MIKHLNIKVTGKVQGVSYRAYTQEKAEELGLSGFVQNEEDGSVYLEAEGEEEQLIKLSDWCKTGSPKAEVTEVKITEAEVTNNFTDFSIKRW